jgi:hypothetical protein
VSKKRGVCHYEKPQRVPLRPVALLEGIACACQGHAQFSISFCQFLPVF